MGTRRSFVGIQRISIVLTLFSSVSSEPTTSPPGSCAIYFHDVEGSTFGSGGAITAVPDANEGDTVGTQIYHVRWDEGGTPANIPQGKLFNEYFDVDESVENQWNITLKKRLTGLPDYPQLKNLVIGSTTFTGYQDYAECDFELRITVEDANTQSPEFEETSYIFTMREDFPVGSDVGGLDVYIRDNDFSEPNNIVNVFALGICCPISAHPEEYKDFEGDFKRVNFILDKALDYETNTTYTCRLVLTDMGDVHFQTSTDLVIIVDNIQDEPPSFTSPFYYAEMDSTEPEEGGTPLSPSPERIEANDGDLGHPSEITYTMQDTIIGIEGTAYFTINSKSGVVSLVKVLDYDILENSKLVFILTATEESGDSDISILEVILPPLPMTSPGTTIETTPTSPETSATSPRTTPTSPETTPSGTPPTSPETTPTGTTPTSPESTPTSPETTPTGTTPTSPETSSPQPEASLSFTQDSYAADIFPSSSTVLTVDVKVEGIDREDVVFSLDDLDTKYFVIESPSGEIRVQEPPEVGTYVLTATANATAPAGQHLEDNATVHIKVLTSFAEVTDA